MAAAMLGACADPVMPPARDVAPVYLIANVAATPVSTLVIEVSAGDLPTPLFFNLERAGDVVRGTLALPVGAARTIDVRAHDSRAEVTHRGIATIDVHPGSNPAVTIVLIPFSGDQPIEVLFSSVTVTVTPAAATITERGTVQLEAAITDDFGNPVAGSVQWATLDRALATVDADGLVTALDVGQVQIIASYAGVAGTATITIIAPPSPTTAIIGTVPGNR